MGIDSVYGRGIRCVARGAELLWVCLGEEEVTEGTVLVGPKASGDGRTDCRAVHERGLTGHLDYLETKTGGFWSGRPGGWQHT